MNFIEIQSWPEVPQIGFFTSLFSSAFNLPDFDIEDLEEALLSDSSENTTINDSAAQEYAPRLIPDLIVALLKGCDLLAQSWSNITASNFQMFLRRIFRHKCEEYDILNPFNTDVDFHSLSLRTKVVILNYLCEFRLDSADVELITNRIEADSLRIEPLGFDSNGSVYWYFFGTRLYREDHKKDTTSKQKQGTDRIWQVICFTEEDWQNLTNKFKDSKSHKEQSLYKCLTEDFLPNIPAIFKAKEAERRRLLFQRRTSSRVKTIQERHKLHQSLHKEETYIEDKNQEKQAKSKIRERIQHERALRAQRRSTSVSSKSSTSSNKASFSLHEGSEDYNNDVHSLEISSQHSLNHNKENILIKKKSNVKKLVCTNVESAEQNFITKMPPVKLLPGRQTNNSLSSITGNIVIQTLQTAPASIAVQPAVNPSIASSSSSTSSTHSRKKPKIKTDIPKNVSSNPRFMETDEVLQIGMHKVLQQVKNHDDAWPFMDPVEEDIAPRYYSIIKRPMDLMKMEEKLDEGEYQTFAEFRTDFKLIVNNCRLYNGQNNEYTHMVNNLQIAFDRATKKYFDQSSSDEEQVLLEYPPIEPGVKVKGSVVAIPTAQKTVQKSDDKKSKHNNCSNKKKMKSDSSSAEDEETEVVEKIKKKSKKKEEKKIASVKEKSTVGRKRKREKDESENVTKSKKIKKSSSDNEDEKDIDSVINKKLESKKNKKSKEKNVVLKELKSNKKSKKKLLLESNSASPAKSVKKQSKQSKKNNNNSSSSTPVKVSKSEKEKLKNNHSNKYYESTDMDSDNESIRDLITENYDDDEQIKLDDNHDKKSSKKKKHEKDATKIAKSQMKKQKKSKDEQKLAKYSDDAFSMSDGERSIAPSITNNDVDSSFERSQFSEIKDKFDLIKERRNKNAIPEKTTPVKEIIKKEKVVHKEKHSKEKKKDDKLSIFDQLLAETKSPESKQHKDNMLKPKSEHEDEKPPKKNSKKDVFKSTALPEVKQTISEIKQKGIKKQNKASLDDLDMETEQTLKDINKWLEHTPRFEYSSSSNSPSRYVIEDIDMHSKIDDNDFRKPIPLMPSSPSTSNKVFQPSVQKDDKVLKDTNNKSLQSLSTTPSTIPNAALSKKGLKEPKRKKSRDKLQPVPKKKELQRTIDRLQPGKTKGNLLTNIQNINKPEEFFPLGSREKIKEIKSSLTVETDESSPKLSLGTVLDASSAFSICNPKTEKECFSDNEPTERKSLSDSSLKGDDIFEKSEINESSITDKDSSKTEVKSEGAGLANDSPSATKPNLNAWFKAFGVPKKPKNVEEPKKLSGLEPKLESSYTSSRQRKLSTGSSMSERSSVEDSPHVSLEERAGAPAPFPSPIGASPMSVSASPKPEENINQKATYPINSSTRVGFYQDTTSTKSSPDKSCSPREMLSPYHGHYSQQSNVYSAANSNNTNNAYSNFYNPESTNKQRQTNYSKTTDSPTPYFDQYKQPMSQDSDFNNSMSPNTNPNSPYQSQQSSPYQQQPNSPYQQTTNSSGNNNNNNISGNIIDTRSPNSPYSQPNSPYQQANQPVSPFNPQTSQAVSQGPSTPQSNPQPPPTFNNQHFNAMFSQPSQQQQQPDLTQFTPNPQQQQLQQQQQEPKLQAPSNFNVNIQQQSNTSSVYNALPQQHQTTAHAASKVNANIMGATQPIAQQSMVFPETPYVEQNKSRSYGNKKIEPHPVPAAAILNDPIPRFTAEHKVEENPKYLDLSKQTNRHHPQYQQLPSVPANAYPKPEYDKNQSYEMLARSMQKAAYGSSISMDSCAGTNDLSYDARQKLASPYASVVPNVPLNQNENIKDLTKSTSISNLMHNSTAAANSMHQAHQSLKTSQPASMDINYKQSPLFNTTHGSSMMELTAFMRDFRQAEDRYSSFPNPTSGFYDKPITPSHMFAKNIVSSASTLQQMFSNPMTTMAYNREQQEYQNRLNAFQAAANTSQSAVQAPQIPVETKAKKPKRSKKNPSPEVSAATTTQHPAMSQHQMPSNQQQSHQQFAMHQQSFQSFAGLKIPSAGSGNSTDPMKAVVPGSAFNYGPTPLGLYGENSPYLDEFRGAQGSYYPPPLRSAEATDKSTPNPPQAHPAAPSSSPYHHLLPSHHASRSYPFMNSIDPAALQQQYRMMFNQTYQAGYLGMHNQPPWHM